MAVEIRIDWDHTTGMISTELDAGRSVRYTEGWAHPELTKTALAAIEIWKAQMAKLTEPLLMLPCAVGKFPIAVRAAAEQARKMAEAETGYRLRLRYFWREEVVTLEYRDDGSH